MAVTAVSASSGTQVKSSSQTLAANFDSFLRLLTTQLQNQDPLAPMDANEFTSQLVEFASVEQAIQTNKRLGELGDLVESSGTTSAMGLLGREVTAGSDQVALGATGDATVRYALPEAAAKATVTILDSRGRALRTLPGGLAAGDHQLAWDGLDAAGSRLPQGSYRIRIDATRADGSAITADPYLVARVEGIEPGASGISLIVGGATVPLSAVRSVRDAPAAAP